MRPARPESMTKDVVRTITSPDGEHRVPIVRRADGAHCYQRQWMIDLTRGEIGHHPVPALASAIPQRRPSGKLSPGWDWKRLSDSVPVPSNKKRKSLKIWSRGFFMPKGPTPFAITRKPTSVRRNRCRISLPKPLLERAANRSPVLHPRSKFEFARSPGFNAAGRRRDW
jgi:hypothetical protein